MIRRTSPSAAGALIPTLVVAVALAASSSSGCAAKGSVSDGGFWRGEAGGDSPDTDDGLPPDNTTVGDARGDQMPACSSPVKVGYRLMTLANGIRLAVWYPTTSAESSFDYGGAFTGMVASGGVPGGCAAPLVVFSHGASGCGTQSLFITERLARAGYVVAAPDHRDAGCAIDSGPKRAALPGQPSLLDTANWTDASFVDRRDDVRQVIDAMLTDSDFADAIDASRIGLMGHSLGGYTSVGLGGGWATWKDPRVKAALLLSPYINTFITKGTLPDVNLPMMYQGAELDLGVTPFLEGAQGAFALSNPPKYFAKLRGGTHFEWTNLICAGRMTVDNCIATQPNAKLMVDYGVAFLDQYLRGSAQSLLASDGTGLSSYQHIER